MTPERLDALEVLLGLALIVTGVAMIHIPTALIVAGVGLLGSTLRRAAHHPRGGPQP
jgi:hypothetical protein